MMRTPTESSEPTSLAVERCLEPMGFEWLDVHRVVCLTNARWGVAPRPYEVAGATVIWGRALVDRVAVRGALGPEDMNAVAMELSASLRMSNVRRPR